MPISYSEQATLTCPSCNQPFAAEVWTIVDSVERPDLAQALRDGTLDTVTCPQCGYQGPSGAPLLFHDPQRRRVYFAIPPDVEEHIWRERANELLYVLVGSLPEEARHGYLGDVHVEYEVEGVRRAYTRGRRGKAAPAEAAVPAPVAPAVESTPTPTQEPAAAPVLDAVRDLLSADSPEAFRMVVEQNPVLLTDAADLTLSELAEVAYNQGERDVAEALRVARTELAALRADTGTPAVMDTPVGTSTSAVPVSEADSSEAIKSYLSDTAYQALIRVDSTDALLDATRLYPALLEPWVNTELELRAELALDDGNERLAVEIEERREALAELRAVIAEEAALLRAVQALIAADDEDKLEQALSDYPILLTDAAQDALLTLSGGARSQGDLELAEYAVKCRAMLRRVRAGLEADEDQQTFTTV